MNLLFVADVIGRPGRTALRHLLPRIIDDLDVHFTVVNGENAAAGYGVTRTTLYELLDAGANCVTSGNHIWAQKEAFELAQSEPRLLRPANYPPGAPGRGAAVYQACSGARVGILNLAGRVFMGPADCPFRRGDEELKQLSGAADVVVVDFHAEATSEKRAYAEHVDGRVAAVIGTHTHVQTADEQVLAGGTAFISDAGMTGPVDSVIGVDKAIIIRRFITGLPARFDVPKRAQSALEGVMVRCDEATGRAREIVRVRRPYPPM